MLNYRETTGKEGEDEIDAIVCVQGDNAKACFSSAKYVMESRIKGKSRVMTLKARMSHRLHRPLASNL